MTRMCQRRDIIRLYSFSLFLFAYNLFIITVYVAQETRAAKLSLLSLFYLLFDASDERACCVLLRRRDMHGGADLSSMLARGATCRSRGAY